MAISSAYETPSEDCARIVSAVPTGTSNWSIIASQRLPQRLPMVEKSKSRTADAVDVALNRGTMESMHAKL